MKKYFTITMLALIATVSLFSCKKDTNTTQPKDYSASIKDKIWWGTFTNAGETPQYYSASFRTDNTVLWSQLSGDYSGTWSLANNKLTITFISPAVMVTANISDDNKLTDITTSSANKVNSGEMLASPNIALDNSTWNGSVTYPLQAYPLLLTFLNSSKVQVKFSSNPVFTADYTRSASSFIKFNWGSSVFAGVISSGTLIKGSFYDGTIYTWQTTKQ
jgi:hypothetical protein